MTFFKKLARDEQGATAIEYGLIAALIAVALISSLGALEDSITGTFTRVGASMKGAGS